MNYFCFISLYLSSIQWSVRSKDTTLCQNPVVYSADRFNNYTVRLFRGNDYWDLRGFPDSVKVGNKSSMTDYEYFNPINTTTRIVTVLEGPETVKDRTFKFDGMFWWSWYIHPEFGVRFVATAKGLYWNELPEEHGFASVFHNGDKRDPMLIGLEVNRNYSDKYMKIHYFSTKNQTFLRKSSQYYSENDFPIDITDAFSWPPSDGAKYVVYILKGNQYCRLTDKQKCIRWTPLREFFRCTKQPYDPDLRPNKPKKSKFEGPSEKPEAGGPGEPGGPEGSDSQGNGTDEGVGSGHPIKTGKPTQTMTTKKSVSFKTTLSSVSVVLSVICYAFN